MRKRAMAMVFAAGLGLAACSRSAPDEPVTTNDTIESAPADDVTPEASPVAPPVAEPTPVATNDTAAIDVPPDPPVAPDAQVIEDADATGMTARVSRDAPPAGNDQAPQ